MFVSLCVQSLMSCVWNVDRVREMSCVLDTMILLTTWKRPRGCPPDVWQQRATGDNVRSGCFSVHVCVCLCTVHESGRDEVAAKGTVVVVKGTCGCYGAWCSGCYGA